MSSSLREKGIEMFTEVYCGDLPPPTPPGQDLFLDFMLESLFGHLWADTETRSIRDRRLLLLGAIGAMGEDATFTIQVRSALKRGELDEKQIHALVTFLTQYVGYPRDSKMKLAVAALLQQMKQANGGSAS